MPVQYACANVSANSNESPLPILRKAHFIVDLSYDPENIHLTHCLLSHSSTQNGVHEVVALAEKIRQTHTESYRANGGACGMLLVEFLTEKLRTRRDARVLSRCKIHGFSRNDSDRILTDCFEQITRDTRIMFFLTV